LAASLVCCSLTCWSLAALCPAALSRASSSTRAEQRNVCLHAGTHIRKNKKSMPLPQQLSSKLRRAEARSLVDVTVVTGPPNGPVLFCSLASVVVVCNAVGRRAGCVGGRPPPDRACERFDGRHCTAGQYGYIPLWRYLVCFLPCSETDGWVGGRTSGVPDPRKPCYSCPKTSGTSGLRKLEGKPANIGSTGKWMLNGCGYNATRLCCSVPVMLAGVFIYKS